MKSAHVDPMFWKGKKVFLTGHTGFKGGWLSLWLASMGAKVTGYALAPKSMPNLFDVLAIDSLIEKSHFADIRDLATLQKAMTEAKPDVVIHMAAQPLVRYSFANPVETYATNVMGTVHALESTRSIDTVRASVVVTTDKCYENKEWVWGYRENDPMGGFDPYSNSKGCAELVTSAYRQSYFSGPNSTNRVASARAGNVIGGGDWSEDRLLPDAVRAFEASSSLLVRSPDATRPWQHVLEPLSGYLILAQKLFEGGSQYEGAWNFGPADEGNLSVASILNLFASIWGPEARWEPANKSELHEAHLLKLDCSRSRDFLGWNPKWKIDQAVKNTASWYMALRNGGNLRELTQLQIKDYENS